MTTSQANMKMIKRTRKRTEIRYTHREREGQEKEIQEKEKKEQKQEQHHFPFFPSFVVLPFFSFLEILLQSL